MIEFSDLIWGGIILLICLLFLLLANVGAALLRMLFEFILSPKKTVKKFKQNGVLKTIKQYLIDAFNDPNMKGWVFNF